MERAEPSIGSGIPVLPAEGAQDILSDGQFVFGPNVGQFDVAAYLQAKGSPLAGYADLITGWCAYASVNPRVVLTCLEV